MSEWFKLRSLKINVQEMQQQTASGIYLGLEFSLN